MTAEGLLPLFYEQVPSERPGGGEEEGQENELAAMLFSGGGDTALQDDVFLSELLATHDVSLSVAQYLGLFYI